MNPSDAISGTQIPLSWTLLGVLLAWMLLCTFLALRPLKSKTKEMASLPAPSGVFPELVVRTPLPRPAPSVNLSRGSISAPSIETANDADKAPVA
ncbi:MAG TPA: hypothetical protein VFV38_40960 [Ktedonobacteraceae bacterium]|nr:hypothetical protein [Ktedonobacteraceae bacterium]